MKEGAILQATTKLYKLTLLFPKKDPLRYKMREAGINILIDIISLNRGGFSNPTRDLNLAIKEEFEILKNLFNLAKKQKWVKEELVLELEREYEKIREKIAFRMAPPSKEILFSLMKSRVEEREGKKKRQPLGEKVRVSLPPFGLDQQEMTKLDKRQRKLLKILQEKKKIQIGQLCKNFPEVSRRTLLRDLEKLSQLGFVVREGEGRGAYYRFQLKKSP